MQSDLITKSFKRSHDFFQLLLFRTRESLEKNAVHNSLNHSTLVDKLGRSGGANRMA